MSKPSDPKQIQSLLAILRNGLTGANDVQLRQVVAMVDSLEDRGQVDALLAPVRARLRHMHPARPLRFSRLLFIPMDPIVVPPQGWTPGTAAMPRNALTPLTQLVRDRMGDQVTPIDDLIQDGSVADTDIIDQAGALLWPSAATILAEATAAPGWTDAGLPANTFLSLARTASFVLHNACRVGALARGMPMAAETAAETLENVLNSAQQAGPAAWRVVLLILLLRLPDTKRVLSAAMTTARSRNTATRVATEQAIEAAIDHLEHHRPTPGETPADAAMQMTAIATLLEGITAGGAGPERNRRVAGLRASLDKTCQTRLQTGLAEQILAPLRERIIEAQECDLEALEQAAPALRSLEGAGRRLGNADNYDRMLRQAATDVQMVTQGTDISPGERARLVELLAGPDIAWAMLQEGRARQSA